VATRPAASDGELRREAPGAGGLKRLLGRTLREVLAQTHVPDALVVLLQPERGLDVRHTPGLPPPDEASLRAAVGRLLAGTAEIELGGAEPRIGLALEVGDGSLVAVIARAADAGQRARFADRCPLLLLALAREILLIRGRRREDELERLNATARRIAASLDLDEVLDEIIRDATELLGADMGDIVLLDPQAGTLRIVAATGPESVGVEWSAEKGLSSRTMAARRTVMVRDYQRYRHRIEELAEYEVHAVLCAPLIARGAVIGTITVHSKNPAYEFQPGHTQLLSAFASHAAIAIENARRYQAETRLARELREANEQLARSLTLQQRLVEQVLSDRGIGGIARELASLLQRPVVLHDDLLRTLAGASPPGGESWEVLALPSDGLRDPALSAFLRELAASRAPSARPAPLRGAPRLVAPVIRSPTEVSGYLVLPWQEPLTSLDRALIEVAITGVALEMAKLRARVELEQDLRGEVVMDLLTGAYSSPDTIAARVAQLGFDLAEPRDVVVLRLEAPAPPDRRLGDSEQLRLRRRFRDVVAAKVGARSPASMVATDGDLVIILAARRRGAGARPDPEPPRSLVEETIEEVRGAIPGAIVSAAIGDLCRATEDYARSYRLTRGALEAACKLGGPGRVVDARSLGVARLIISSGDREELLDFARRRLGPLLGGGEFERLLLSTLRTYVESGFNQRETARRAYLHPNTVAYRLRKVGERLGTSLDDPSVRLDLALALQIGLLADLL